MDPLNRMRGRNFASGGYEGVTHAGIAIVAGDTARVLMARRAMDESDDPEVQETWEFPGGGLNPGEEPLVGAEREYLEECCLPFPDGEVTNGWRAGPEDNYQGFVYLTREEFDLSTFVPNDEVQEVSWMNRVDLDQEESHGRLRPELARTMDWSLIWGSDEEEAMTAAATEGVEDYEPVYEPGDFTLDAPIPVHGVIAPEEMPSGDKRGFSAGAMTRRPLRLPLSDQKVSVSQHDGSVVVGSVDRMMRKDGLIHWEGLLMNTPEADDLAGRVQFFDGRYGVSVDGDQGSLDQARTEETATMWFDSVRASGLTAVSIPAFHEAYIAFGHHPEMPAEETLAASAYEAGDLIGGRVTFDRGPGWVTNPRETKRIHDYWTKKGEPGYAKIGWGTSGDWTRAKKLIGAKIAANSPEDMKYLNQIISQWHYDALGYWPGELGKPGNPPDTKENRRRAAVHADLDVADLGDRLHSLDREGIEPSTDLEESVWETVLVSSVSGNQARPPLSYFHEFTAGTDGALTIEEPDANGFRRVHGFAAQWGVCHIGLAGQCVEPPRTYSDDYPEFHLGRTKTDEGYVYTGVLTYGVGHRDADTILNESAEQAYFDNINNAWAAVRVGENDTGIWFSGVVLPGVPEDHLVKIEASGQVSGEWLRGAMRACLTVNVPGYAVERPTAAYDENGNVVALAASAFGGVPDAPCNEPEPVDDPVGDLALAVMDRIAARTRMDLLIAQHASDRWAALKAKAGV